ncbi:MAG: hypothetical protein AAF846_19880 [Chloroflexota bacterium]
MKYVWMVTCIILLGACVPNDDPSLIPTRTNPDAVATGIILTENAPPAGFDTVSFPEIDANLEQLSGWRYQMFFSFDGVFARTPRETGASTQATVTYDQVGSRRLIDATIDVDLEDIEEPIIYEGVRLGADTFLVRDGSCATNTDSSELLADLSAGQLLGGVNLATTAVQRERINGEEVWLYRFLADDLVLPNVQLGDDSRLLSMVGELWVAPEHNVVVRYILQLEVENATIFDQTLPISGTVNMQYNVFDIGTIPNISIPNGC